MPSENLFRVAFAVVILLTVVVTATYRIRAASSGERISHKEEGYLFAAVLRLAGLCPWITAFAYLLFPSSVRWAQFPLPDGVRWAAAVAGACCSPLMYWALSSLGKHLTDTVATRAAHVELGALIKKTTFACAG